MTDPAQAPEKGPGPTRSYREFESVAHRSLNLIAIQPSIEQILLTVPDAKPIDLSDMTRAALVLAVAAMDAYFTDVFVERFVPFLRKKGPTPEMIRILNEAGLDTRCALELLSMERPYRRVRTLVEGYFARMTTQRHSVIDELFAAYGFRNLSQNVQQFKGLKNLLRSVEIAVHRRHKIVHKGDLNKHGRTVEIDLRKTKIRIKKIITFVSGADELLQRQFPI